MLSVSLFKYHTITIEEHSLQTTEIPWPTRRHSSSKMKTKRFKVWSTRREAEAIQGVKYVIITKVLPLDDSGTTMVHYTTLPSYAVRKGVSLIWFVLSLSVCFAYNVSNVTTDNKHFIQAIMKGAGAVLTHHSWQLPQCVRL